MTINGFSLAAEALKSFMLPGLIYQLNDKASALLAQIEKSRRNVDGKDVKLAMRYGAVGGIGNRSDVGTLPTPNPRKTKQATWETKNIFGRIQISDKTIKASESTTGAFANLLTQDVADCEGELKMDVARQVAGDGTGKLATLTGNSSYTSGPPAYVSFTVGSTNFLREGMLVDVYTSGNSAVSGATEREILFVDDNNLTVRVSVASDISSSVVSGCYIVRTGNYSMEITGTAAVLASSGTLYGLSKSTYPWLVPQILALNTEISENAMQKIIDLIETRTGCSVNFIQMALGVRRAYGDYLSANKQFPNTIDLKGGWKGLDFKGIPIVSDRFVDSGRIEFYDLNSWGMYQMGEYDWMDRDSMFVRVANTPAWEATLVKYCDIGCDVPRGQGVITGVTEH